MVEDTGLIIERHEFVSFYWVIWHALLCLCQVDHHEGTHPALDHWAKAWDVILADPITKTTHLRAGSGTPQVPDHHRPKTRLTFWQARPINAPQDNMKPVILAYSETNDKTFAERIGMSEYSYYFVLKMVSSRNGRSGRRESHLRPATEADLNTTRHSKRADSASCSLFAPPHRTLFPERCPVIPLVAWELSASPITSGTTTQHMTGAPFSRAPGWPSPIPNSHGKRSCVP